MSQNRNWGRPVGAAGLPGGEIECAAIGIDTDHRTGAGVDRDLRILPGVAAEVQESCRVGSRDELLCNSCLARPSVFVIGILYGVFLPVASALPFQSFRVTPQTVGERNQVPAWDPASISDRARAPRRRLQFPHRPRLGMKVHQHLRAATGREGKCARHVDQVKAIEPTLVPLVEVDAGEGGQAQRGEELLAELLVAEEGSPFLVLLERKNIDEDRAGIDELHVEGRRVLQRVAIPQSIGEQLQGQTRRLLQALEGPLVGIGDEGKFPVLRPHVPCIDIGRRNAGLHDLFRAYLPSLDDARAGAFPEEVRANKGSETIGGPMRDAAKDPLRSDEDAPFRIAEGTALPTRRGEYPYPLERADGVPSRRRSAFASCPGSASSAGASTKSSR